MKGNKLCSIISTPILHKTKAANRECAISIVDLWRSFVITRHFFISVRYSVFEMRRIFLGTALGTIMIKRTMQSSVISRIGIINSGRNLEHSSSIYLIDIGTPARTMLLSGGYKGGMVQLGQPTNLTNADRNQQTSAATSRGRLFTIRTKPIASHGRRRGSTI